jgi:hypothetical protein
MTVADCHEETEERAEKRNRGDKREGRKTATTAFNHR